MCLRSAANSTACWSRWIGDCPAWWSLHCCSVPDLLPTAVWGAAGNCQPACSERQPSSSCRELHSRQQATAPRTGHPLEPGCAIPQRPGSSRTPLLAGDLVQWDPACVAGRHPGARAGAVCPLLSLLFWADPPARQRLDPALSCHVGPGELGQHACTEALCTMPTASLPAACTSMGAACCSAAASSRQLPTLDIPCYS